MAVAIAQFVLDAAQNTGKTLSLGSAPQADSYTVVFVNARSRVVSISTEGWTELWKEPMSSGGNGSVGAWGKIGGNSAPMTLDSSAAWNSMMVELTGVDLDNPLAYVGGPTPGATSAVKPTGSIATPGVEVLAFTSYGGYNTSGGNYEVPGSYSDGFTFYQAKSNPNNNQTSSQWGTKTSTSNPEQCTVTLGESFNSNIFLLGIRALGAAAADKMSGFDGAAFQTGVPKAYDGAAFVPSVPKYFDGASWVTP